MLLHHCECVGLDAACVKTVHETLRAVSVGKKKNCVIMLLCHCVCWVGCSLCKNYMKHFEL